MILTVLVLHNNELLTAALHLWNLSLTLFCDAQNEPLPRTFRDAHVTTGDNTVTSVTICGGLQGFNGYHVSRSQRGSLTVLFCQKMH